MHTTSHNVAVAVLLFACATVSACSDPTTALPAPAPSVALSTAMSSLALAQGDSGSVDVTIVRTGGFSGPVTLTVAGVPTGVTADVASTPVAGRSASLNLRVYDTAIPGAYPLRLTAVGDGIATQILPLDLHVAQRTPQSIAVRYCSGLEPSWVAFQDGNGAWTRAQPSLAGGTVTFQSPFSTNRGAVATLNDGGGGLTVLSVLYGTPAELVAAGDTNPRDCASGSKTLLGTVAGLESNDVAFVGGAFFSRVRVRVDRTFELKGLPDGPHDLFATRTAPTNQGDAITGFILRRDINVPDSTTLPVLDFAAPEAFAPAVATVSLNGLGTEGATSATRLLTRHTEVSVTLLTNPTTAVTRPYFALPETQLLASDMQILSASVSAATTGSARTTTLYFRAPTDRTLTFGAPLIPPTFITVATAPALRLRARFVAQNDYDRSAVISYQQGTTTFVTIAMTAAHAALAGAGYDLLVPDLSRAPGFEPAWALRPEGTLLSTAGRVGGTLGLGRDAVPGDGATQRTAFRADTIAAQ